MELLRDTEPGPASGGAPGPSGEETARPRMSPATIAAKVGGSPARAPPSLPGQYQEARRLSSGPALPLVGVPWSLGGEVEGGGGLWGARLQPTVSPSSTERRCRPQPATWPWC